MDVSIEATDFIARWERLDVQILSLKRLLVRRVDFVVFTFRFRNAHGDISGRVPGNHLVPRQRNENENHN